MLLPLLSLCLATLMALFRDVEIGLTVSTEELTLLLREAGVALLDPRLSSDQLSEETGSQMVRAINKVIIADLWVLFYSVLPFMGTLLTKQVCLIIACCSGCYWRVTLRGLSGPPDTTAAVESERGRC